ncbi:Dual specificity tyrosine-phosphorylation-regulated kinase 4 [Tritrichomonas foetus]|uniref:dual-specificity kinase n=1 Tax=Tritrichomonas foetus TaxID=1144522 RepID=A0A1J4JK69_9EUKA|nr:Dual specificity tyrosine-phosphorylation-regulated kinase 4 [Tritrichomonas foetus]|eukprot:OHS99528.1 Dual specificity tyrosine-phosphorylation-regulated kinase 4 [Tritrichomonas foetus]
MILHPKKAPRRWHENQKILPSLQKVQEPASARPKEGSSRRSPRNISHKTIRNSNSARNLSDEYPSLPNAPLKPSEVLANYSAILTERERYEIERYHDIYYIRKGPPDPKSHMLYDPDFFPFVKDDHIRFQYQMLAELGRGAFGCVMKCYDHKNQRLCAVKLVRDFPKIHTQIQLEKEILEALIARDSFSAENHVIRVYETFGFRSFAVFVFEVLSCNLYEHLKSNKFKGLEISKVKTVTLQIGRAIKFMHSLGLIHCDIKPENMLWTGPRHLGVKLIDFGCSCYVDHTLFTYIQSRFYRAPEVMLGLEYGQEIDVWSFGCVLCELITGRPIFPGEDESEQMAIIQAYLGSPPIEMLYDSPRRDHFFDDDFLPIIKPNKRGVLHQVSSKSIVAYLNIDEPLLVDIILKCLRWDPEQRITMAELTNHSWFAKEKSMIPAQEKRSPNSAR